MLRGCGAEPPADEPNLAWKSLNDASIGAKDESLPAERRADKTIPTGRGVSSSTPLEIRKSKRLVVFNPTLIGISDKDSRIRSGLKPRVAMKSLRTCLDSNEKYLSLSC